jgi:hypothetical protein
MIEFGLTIRVTVSCILDLSSIYVCTSYTVAMFARSLLIIALVEEIAGPGHRGCLYRHHMEVGLYQRPIPEETP